MEQDQNSITEKEISIEIDDLRKKFQCFIEAGLESLDTGKSIAILEYSDQGSSNKTKKIEFIYKCSNISNKRVSPSILIKTNNQEYIWNAGWNLFSGKSDDESIGLNTYKFPKWEVIKVHDNEEIEATPFDFAPIDLPMGYKVGRNFINFWFSKKDTTKKQETPITLMQPIGEKTDFKSAWDRLDYSNGKFKVDQLPATPKYDRSRLNFCANQKLAEEWARFFIVLFVCRFILGVLSVEKNEVNNSFKKEVKFEKFFTSNKVWEDKNNNFLQALYTSLPVNSKYRPKRPVDIDPHTIDNHVKEKLKIPWHVISSASAALNAGKHIIFTGPPGCGKTRLAELIAKHASKIDPLMTTASQAWSTDEVIGRYMPMLNGEGLEFKDGFFLRALEEDKWLIIDEMNRCDIDNCFGELFTVLSGQSVAIPFDKKSENGTLKPIRINVGGDSEENDTYESVTCSEKFRLLATMNDADIAGLHQLSYALRRRFAIIRVDAPSDEVKQEIFETKIEKVEEKLELKHRIYQLKNNNSKKSSRLNFKNVMKQQINKLFACEENNGVDDLIDLRVVGIAPALDIIRFVGEGLRSSDTNKRTIKHAHGKNAEKQLINSFLAMGLVLNVFPQLDAVSNEPKIFENAIKRITTTFDPTELFFRIEKSTNLEEEILQLQKSNLTIRDYLRSELDRQYSQDRETLKIIGNVFEESHKGSPDKKQEN